MKKSKEMIRMNGEQKEAFRRNLAEKFTNLLEEKQIGRAHV